MENKTALTIILGWTLQIASAIYPGSALAGSANETPPVRAAPILEGVVGSGSSSHGSDFVTGHAAWFRTSNRPINVCVNVDAGYPFSRDEVVTLINRTFSTFVTYLERKKIIADWQEPDDSGGKRGSAGLGLARTLNWVSCEQEDIAFYFGPVPTHLLQVSLMHPTALAFASKELDLGLWAKGAVWVGGPTFPVSAGIELLADERGLLAVETLLLHEWGHVLGFPHISGTIMGEDIAFRVLSHLRLANAFPDHSLNKIDQLRRLILDPFTDPTKGFLGGTIDESRNIRRALFGSYDPLASTDGEAVLTLDRTRLFGTEFAGNLTVRDGDRSVALPLSFSTTTLSLSDEFLVGVEKLTGRPGIHGAVIGTGLIHPPKSRPLVIDVFLNGSPLASEVILVRCQGLKYLLFSSQNLTGLMETIQVAKTCRSEYRSHESCFVKQNIPAQCLDSSLHPKEWRQ